MNASIAIALLTKLKLIFETDASGEKQDSKFLSFQNGHFSTSKELFYFIQPDKYGIDATETATRRYEFASLFNFIAETDDLITPTPELLQDVYSRVLGAAIPANSHRTAEEEIQYKQAIEYLNKETEVDGVVTTPLTTYEQYEQLHKVALSEYKTRKLEATFAEGIGADVVKEKWLLDEPTLNNNITKALLAWETKGLKEEVEKWLALFNKLAGASPVKTLSDLQSDYTLFSKMYGADQGGAEFSYLPTLFNPSNFFDDGVPWQTLTLDKMEVASLYEKAPAKLREIFELDDSEPGIQHIEFEYAVVSIVREWFPFKEFFNQRFWKLPEGQPMISDGNGGGLIPAFPEKMIFTRNVTIRYERPVSAQPGNAGKLTAEIFRKLEPKMKMKVETKAGRIMERRIKPGAFRTERIHIPDAAAEAKATDAMPAISRKFSASLFKAADFRKFADIHVKPKPPEPPPTPAAPVIIEEKFPSMELLAFICRKMPLCPNPDPALTWT